MNKKWMWGVVAACLLIGPAAAAQDTDEPELIELEEIAVMPDDAGESAALENLEFVSGEVTAVDAASKTVTVKLYGETQPDNNDKTITVTSDENTDITDGETDREISSLAAGAEVDVEYDPATNKATYIFVY